MLIAQPVCWGTACCLWLELGRSEWVLEWSMGLSFFFRAAYLANTSLFSLETLPADR